MTDDGQFEVDIPRDRDGSFEPQIVKKHQTRLTAMDDKIHCLYAKGMTTREIVATFKEMYDADVSPALISKVTNTVLEKVIEWQSRPLEAVFQPAGALRPRCPNPAMRPESARVC